MINEVLQGDCLKLMPQIPTGSIDMIFCDLPFGTTRSDWDVIVPFEPLWLQYERIIKDNGAIVLFAKAPFDKMLWASNPKIFRYEWIWMKNKTTGHLNADHMPMQQHENILVFYKSPPTYNPQKTVGHKPMNFARSKSNSTVYGKEVAKVNDAGTTERHPTSVLRFPVVNNDDPERVHPNQKPLDLCEYLIRTYTNEGETILDNCTGSASIPLAAINSDRNFIAMEKTKKYYWEAKNRLENRQIVLNF